ncbi:BEN domain-containing protein 5-like [Parasteatoda tepidariorum]|uniref:BEN domain-containing protein 5-like n=1 Tax=Parasteatoda tepidariorum TaxID=114398 RepID=UPI001C72896A|nr:uncharacterized protein LOC107454004 [Parasteatoda tepidariorum]
MKLLVYRLKKKTKSKKEDAEMKHRENAGKRKRANDIFEEGKRSRKEIFSKLDLENETDGFVTSDSDDDPEVIPSTMFRQLKTSYDMLEKEKADKKIENLERKILQLEKQAENVDNNEVVQLRSLNRQLQERLLCLPTSQVECSCTARKLPEIQEASDSETMEVELGGGISINKTVYKELFQLDHVRKFTKSLAVAIWGTAASAGRSVTGKVCKNGNGPKKAVSGAIHPHPQQDSKPPLTPEKLAVISDNNH